MEEDTYGGMIPPAKLPHTLISFNEHVEHSFAPRLTENIIIDAEETGNEVDGKPLFHISESSPRLSVSRKNSMIGIAIGTLDLLNRGVGVPLNRICRDFMEEEKPDHLNKETEECC